MRGNIISYIETCQKEGTSLQRGMNFRLKGPGHCSGLRKIKAGIWTDNGFFHLADSTSIKPEVWARDGGKCVTRGATDELHFDHILPYSKGGTSLKAENIQLLCARHNLRKSAKIE